MGGMTRKRKFVIVVAGVVLLLVAGRIALPYIVEDYANEKLAALDSYDGHVGDIDMHLWRGAYSIDDIVIVKTGAKRPVPFFSSRRVDLSVEWRSLLKGSVVAEAKFDGPRAQSRAGKIQGRLATRQGRKLECAAGGTVPVPLQHHWCERRHGALSRAGHQHARRDHRAPRPGPDHQPHQRDRLRQGDLCRFSHHRRCARRRSGRGQWQRRMPSRSNRPST